MMESETPIGQVGSGKGLGKSLVEGRLPKC
jgi:hypothetical protein